MDQSIIFKIIISVPPLMIAIILHEIAHGYCAWKLGDPTAKDLGRITLNPFKHIDPVLSILLPGLLIVSGSPIIFGGAKPVPVNPYYFKNPRKEMAYVAIAGPLMNLVLLIISYLLFFLLLPYGQESLVLGLVKLWLLGSIIINLVLALFNLFPFPPLDGGRIVVGFLPIGLARAWSKLEPYGLFIIFGLLLMGIPQQILVPSIEFILVHIEQHAESVLSNL